MTITKLTVPVSVAEERGPFVQSLLGLTQGHILARHRHEDAWSILVQFGDLPRVRQTLAALAITDAAAARAAETGSKLGGALFVGLTAAGCRKLGVADNLLDPIFEPGFAQRAGQDLSLGTKSWRAPWTGDDATPRLFDAVIVVAGSWDFLTEQENALRAGGAFSFVALEKGAVKRSPTGDPIEHFGFADGVSQPVFFERDLPTPGVSAPGFSPATPLPRVLVPDFLAPEEPAAFGSYLAHLRAAPGWRSVGGW